jgi:hypothetical protein
MIPRDHLMTRKIQPHKARLRKQPSSLIEASNVTIEDPTEELNATKALQAAIYKKSKS